MADFILRDHSYQVENLSIDLKKLAKIREEYYDSAEKLISKKLADETELVKSIETQMQTIVQRTKNWPKSVMTKSSYSPTVSVTTIIHCKKCLAKVSISRSTQTLPSFVQTTRLSSPTPVKSPKAVRGILRKPSNEVKIKSDVTKDKKVSKTVTKSKESKTKQEPLIEWSAMEWNGKNEIDEINQKIKVLNDRIENFSTNGTENMNCPDVFREEWKGHKSTATFDRRNR